MGSSSVAGDDHGAVTELAALREAEPPPGLVARVMTRVAERPPVTLWQLLRRPLRFELRLSPLSALLGTGVAVMLGFALASPQSGVGGGGTGTAGPALSQAPAIPRLGVPEKAAGDAPILVRFVLEARGARHVFLAGSFNDWSREATPLVESNGDGLFVTTVALPPGTHEYMFVVDGAWMADPTTSDRRPDGFGRQNSLLRL